VSLAAIAAPPPLEQRSQVRALRNQLTEIDRLIYERDFEPAMARAELLAKLAHELPWPPLAVEAQLRIGHILRNRSELLEAKSPYIEAYFVGSLSRMPLVAFNAAANLTNISTTAREFEEGLLWSRHMDLAIASAQDDLHLLEAKQLHTIGALYVQWNRAEEARTKLEAALAIREDNLLPDHPDIAKTLSELASAYDILGDAKACEAANRRAIAILESALSPTHPELVVSRTNLGLYLAYQNDLPQAITEFERALEIAKIALDPKHHYRGTIESNLGAALLAKGELELARAHLEIGLDITEAKKGHDAPEVARVLASLGELYLAQGNPQAALPPLERALTIADGAEAFEEERIAILNVLGEVQLRLENTTDSAKYFELARSAQTAINDQHPRLATSLVGLAELALREGQLDKAIEQAQQAVSIMQKSDPGGRDDARAKFVLARALWAREPGSAEATEQAKAAASTLDEGDQRDEIEEWLAQHR
jgi:tetratricopeptide (TPR) repeat protein